MKDVILARSRDEAARTPPAWSIPGHSYVGLMWTLKGQSELFPLLTSMTAHSEGPEGDFSVTVEQIPSLVREIDLLLAGDVPIEDDVKDTLTHLLKLAHDAQKLGLAIFGIAD